MATRTNSKGKMATIEVGREPTPQLGSFGLEADRPWTAEFTIKGTSSLVFHRWAVDDGDGPTAKKGSNKTDDVDSYVFRCEDGSIGLPGEYVRQAMIFAAKYHKDPRSARAGGTGLFKAGIVSNTEIATLGSEDWDYLDRRRAVIQRQGITRVRPAFLAGWEATFEFTVLLHEYITPQLFMDVLRDAGQYAGVGDMRPSYGRFAVVKFETS